MIYEECKYCKNHYDMKHTEGCSRIFYEFEADKDGYPIKVDGVCHGFKRSGLFKDLPYKIRDDQLRKYIENNLNTFLGNYTANELMDIIYGDLEKDVIEFLKSYFYDAALINGVKVIEND